MKTILGLDLGTTSVGWALIKRDDKGSGKLVDGGVRIFQGVTEPKSGALKNQSRRIARGTRVNLQRRSARKNALKNALIEAGLLPKEVLDAARAPDLLNSISVEPYKLRAKALTAPLTDHELGRAILSLGMRRGFLSNRKSGDSDSKKVLPAIDALTSEIEQAGCATLGEYLASQPTQRGRYTHRSMFENELNAIWENQSKSNVKLTPKLKEKVEHYILFQNPLKIQKYLVGKCALEPSKRRAAKWQRVAQTFRIWQDVSRIRSASDGQPLSWDQQMTIVDELQKKTKLTWKAVRKLLGLDADYKFNLEESGSLKELKGNETMVRLTKALKNHLPSLGDEDLDKILCWLDTSDQDEKLRAKITRGYDFDDDTVEAICSISLPSGYYHLSVKACSKIVEVFKTCQEPLSYREAAEKAGYSLDEMSGSKGLKKLPLPPLLRNPVVEKSLSELRKVVNAILKKYGKPDSIHLEVARDLKNPKKVREEIQKHQKEQEKLRELAKKALKSDFAAFQTSEPSREDIEKYLLWRECSEDGNSQCPYTGKVISGDMLFTNEVQVEHIIPYSRSLDNSFKNKTLCIASENAAKGNKTPFEAYSDSGNYDAILTRISKLPYGKRQRFKLKQLPPHPEPQRLLNDTRYICKEGKSFLQQLGVRVQVSTGQLTAGLRWKWNINGLLNDDGANAKNRDDHRHHFLDAAVIAATTASTIQLISRLAAKERIQRSLPRGLFGIKALLDEPWNGFRGELSSHLEDIIVSHAPTRKVSGALHEETALGKVETKNGIAFATRVALDKSFGLNKVEFIADRKIKEIIRARLAAFHDDPKKAFADLAVNPVLHVDGKTLIKSVRIHKNDSIDSLAAAKQGGNEYAYYRKKSNHQLVIFETEKDEWAADYSTVFDSARLKKNCLTIPERAVFIMNLCKNDMVEMDWENQRAKFRLQEFSPPNNKLVFRLHLSALTSSEAAESLKRVSPNSFKKLNPRKIEVSPIGDVFYVGKQNR